MSDKPERDYTELKQRFRNRLLQEFGNWMDEFAEELEEMATDSADDLWDEDYSEWQEAADEQAEIMALVERLNIPEHHIMDYQLDMMCEAIESICSNDKYPYNKDESPDEIANRIREEVRKEYEDDIDERICDQNAEIEALKDEITTLHFKIERLKGNV